MNTKPAITPPAAVAVIGLGNMGVPMASRLVQAGFMVTGFDLFEPARQRFSVAGGKIAADAINAVKSADMVITLLPDGRAVRAAVEGIQKSLKPGLHRHGDELVRSARARWERHAPPPDLNSRCRKPAATDLGDQSAGEAFGPDTGEIATTR